MSLAHYVWTLGLAEALVVSLIISVLLFVKWRRLKRELAGMVQGRAEVAALLHREIEAAEAHSGPEAPAGDSRLTCLRALASPFDRGRALEEDAWRSVLESLHRCFDGLAQHGTGRRLKSGAASSVSSEREGDAPDCAQADSRRKLDIDLDADIQTLIEHYKLTRHSLRSNHQTMIELDASYRRLKDVNLGLQATLDDVIPAQGNDRLREELEEAKRCSQQLLKSASASKRNFNLLAQQCEGLEDSIKQLQATIRGYRASVRELIVARDGYAEQARELAEQLELREKLVERLRHNYQLLREEYDKLYGVTQ